MVMINNIELTINRNLGSFAPTLRCEESDVVGVYFVNLEVVADEIAQLPDLVVSWDLPSVDLHHKWNSRCLQNERWSVCQPSSRITVSMPISFARAHCFSRSSGSILSP